MKDALVIQRGGQLGDSLNALPAICALAEKHEKLWLCMCNDDVRKIALLPKNVKDFLNVQWAPPYREPLGLAFMEVYSLGVAASIKYKYTETMMHPIQHLFAYVGLAIPQEVPRPQLQVPFASHEQNGEPGFDVVLAPWTTASERSLTKEEVRAVIKALGTLRVAVIGGEGDPRIHQDSFYGRDLPFVVRMMRKAKVVVTVDSGPSRLAHAAAIENHLLLSARVVPEQWATHPGATVIRGDAGKWDAGQIATTVRGML